MNSAGCVTASRGQSTPLGESTRRTNCTFTDMSMLLIRAAALSVALEIREVIKIPKQQQADEIWYPQ